MHTTTDSSSKRILVGQAAPQGLTSPYSIIGRKYGFSVTFNPFMRTEAIDLSLFRKYKPMILQKTAFLFTNKASIDIFFRLSKACNIKFPPTTKYFCASVQVSLYLQKHIELKKRKVFTGEKKLEDLFPIILRRHKKERFMYLCSNKNNGELGLFFKENGLAYNVAEIYRIMPCDMDDIKDRGCDVAVFFTPTSVRYFKKGMPDFDPTKTTIAAFGTATTATLEKEMGWKVAIRVPSSSHASMPHALEAHLKTVLAEVAKRV